MTAKLDLPIYKVGATYRHQVFWNSLLPVEYITQNSGLVTVRCKKPHLLSTNQLVTIQNVVPFEFNVSNVAIIVIDTRTFTYTISIIPSEPVARFFNDSSCLVPVDLTGCTASWTLFDKNKVQIFQATTSPNLVITALQGKIDLLIQDSETALLPEITLQNPISFNLKIFHPSGDTTFLIEGFLTEPFGIPPNVVSTDLDFIVITSAQGAPGIPGVPGAGTASTLTFSWGDATPALIGSALAGKTVYKVEINILVPFDTISTLTVGDSSNNASLFPASNIDLQTVGSYETNPSLKFVSTTDINLYLSPRVGNTQGNGLILLYIQE